MIFFQLMLAVKFLHDQDILHLDLKFESFFLMIDGTLKLADFGLMKELAHSHSNAITSPNVIAGKSYSKDADIFSLGILLN